MGLVVVCFPTSPSSPKEAEAFPDTHTLPYHLVLLSLYPCLCHPLPTPTFHFDSFSCDIFPKPCLQKTINLLALLLPLMMVSTSNRQAFCTGSGTGGEGIQVVHLDQTPSPPLPLFGWWWWWLEVACSITVSCETLHYFSLHSFYLTFSSPLPPSPIPPEGWVFSNMGLLCPPKEQGGTSSRIDPHPPRQAACMGAGANA